MTLVQIKRRSTFDSYMLLHNLLLKPDQLALRKVVEQLRQGLPAEDLDRLVQRSPQPRLRISTVDNLLSADSLILVDNSSKPWMSTFVDTFCDRLPIVRSISVSKV
ncbi:hypothetical protein SCP_1600080 [Sparassis crispa]|uniref:Uncharacterized protein n=1 Tax=Sparassis crispa TaxID=139825 RepID=A0A401H4I7_9APHY|nr:hypothetical protein SCP_1600080 [Sparassis crispa]GBE89347.1 hypothetical protein SCP_1600080 [Sparassis crispa]